MEQRLKATSELLQEVELHLMTLDRSVCEESARPINNDLSRLFMRIEDSFRRLDAEIARQPAALREEGCRKREQLRSDASFIQSSYNTLNSRLQARWKAASDREELLNKRFEPNSCCAVNVGEVDIERDVHSRLKASNKGVDEMIVQGYNVLKNIQSQGLEMKETRKKMRSLGNMLGLSSTTINIIDRRLKDDCTLFIAGVVLCLIFMASFYYYWRG
ncbi:unnamed protein product [Caenorhabditis auriculariae]|uniref:Golgi SNAP receptor complex member 2 n=1 Tax=Caenorhabditis auriculariae TaxID=2777116 RepID=A0A8S1H7D0_9PELO|nr:unnamed protein product [Caenorhabditis auriculariae]